MPNFQITTPDGQKYVVTAPEGASQEDVLAYAQQHHQASSQPPAAPPQPQVSQSLGFEQGVVKPLLNTASGVQAALTAPAPDGPFHIPSAGNLIAKGIGYVGSKLGIPSPQEAKQQYADYIASQAKKGVVPGKMGRFAGEVVGTLPIMAAAPGALAGGALAGASLSDATDPVGIAKDAALGAAGGKVGEKLVGLAAGALPLAKAAVPGIDALKQTARNAYKAVDNSGMVISGKAMAGLTQNIESDLANKGIDASLHPKATAAFNRIASASTNPQTGGNVTLQGLEILRRVAGEAAKSTEPSEKFMGRVIQDHIDDFVDKIGPTDVVGNVDQNALNALGTARSLWKNSSKAEILDSAMQKAKNSAAAYNASGYENAIRSKFRNLANNSRAIARFSPEEQQAIQNVAQGGPIGNALRFLGKFAPHGFLSATLGGGAAYEAGGPLAAGALFAGGEAARQGATILTKRNANLASELVRNGGVPAATAGPSYAAQLLSKLKTPARIAGPAAILQARSNGR